MPDVGRFLCRSLQAALPTQNADDWNKRFAAQSNVASANLNGDDWNKRFSAQSNIENPNGAKPLWQTPPKGSSWGDEWGHAGADQSAAAIPHNTFSTPTRKAESWDDEWGHAGADQSAAAIPHNTFSTKNQWDNVANHLRANHDWARAHVQVHRLANVGVTEAPLSNKVAAPYRGKVSAAKKVLGKVESKVAKAAAKAASKMQLKTSSPTSPSPSHSGE